MGCWRPGSCGARDAEVYRLEQRQLAAGDRITWTKNLPAIGVAVEAGGHHVPGPLKPAGVVTDHVVPQARATRLSHAGRAGTRVRAFVNPPLLRGSTMLYPSCEGLGGSSVLTTCHGE